MNRVSSDDRIDIYSMIEPSTIGHDIRKFVNNLVTSLFEIKGLSTSSITEVRVRSNNIDNQIYVKVVYGEGDEKHTSYIPINKCTKHCNHGRKTVLHFREYECKFNTKNKRKNGNNRKYRTNNKSHHRYVNGNKFESNEGYINKPPTNFE